MSGLNKTPIEWVKNPDGSQGYTWNPITGCLNHIEGMCKGGGFPCYAYRLANGRLRERYLANPNIALPKHLEGLDLHSEDVWEYQKNPFYPRFWEDRLIGIRRDISYAQSKRWGSEAQDRGIFVCDMSDLFGIGIPEEWTRKVLDVIKDCLTDRFYLLTKQPQNLIKFTFPENCWVGVTATDTRMAREACLKLGDIEATVRFLSLEPMLHPISLPFQLLVRCNIAQVIIGAQTNPYKPPKIEWVQEIVQAADKAGVKVFLKDNLKLALPFNDAEWAWARDRYATSHSTNVVYTGLLRQELPK